MNITLTLTEDQLEAIVDRLAKKLGGPQSGNPLTIGEFAAALKKSKGFVRARVEADIIRRLDQPGEILIPASELERFRTSMKA